ncbi:Sugar phosphate isomerase/epimerase [Abditibacterium utsteinense]|uniref:Sugar phosphate isomerase/epimerase n=1 Tax=Abditibacterium utsteinense TaxID=1960156 RepID=A0A2S8SWN1_9BACT|nr:sugar phosphate isomerase/epimerase [Abditibacterium utsteinense]PQV65169.1 Sugar phosphate isomerase/epimerase [Abditibacterium utsteinense]
MMQIPISLQLYTLRAALQKNPLETLERVAQIGYSGIEAGLDSTSEFLNKARELNLKITAAHVSLAALRGDIEDIVSKCQAMETSFAVLSWIEESERGDAQKWQDLGRFLDEKGAQLHEGGITLCYHNHDFEFQSFDGKFGLDWLFEAASPQYLQAELDTYWVQKGGASPVEYLKKYAGRVPLLHIKDMTPDGDFAEIGEGILDWPAIFATAQAQGVTSYIVEQDECAGDPFDSIALSLENLRKMGQI